MGFFSHFLFSNAIVYSCFYSYFCKLFLYSLKTFDVFSLLMSICVSTPFILLYDNCLMGLPMDSSSQGLHCSWIGPKNGPFVIKKF